MSPEEFRNESLLRSAAIRPFQSAFEVDAYPTLLEKAAALFHSLIANHPFHNGNKRTAVLAVDQFLLANDLFLDLSNQEMYELAKEVATYKERGITHDDILARIVTALESNSTPLSLIVGSVELNQLRKEAEKQRRRIRNYKPPPKAARIQPRQTPPPPGDPRTNRLPR